MFIPFLSSKIPGFSGNHLIILTFCVCPDSQDCKRMKHVTQLHCHVDVDFQQNPTTWFAAGKSWGRRPRPWGARSGGAACCWWGAEFFNTHFFVHISHQNAWSLKMDYWVGTQSLSVFLPKSVEGWFLGSNLTADSQRLVGVTMSCYCQSLGGCCTEERPNGPTNHGVFVMDDRWGKIM